MPHLDLGYESLCFFLKEGQQSTGTVVFQSGFECGTGPLRVGFIRGGQAQGLLFGQSLGQSVCDLEAGGAQSCRG